MYGVIKCTGMWVEIGVLRIECISVHTGEAAKYSGQ
jgi:hypothetical protein